MVKPMPNSRLNMLLNLPENNTIGFPLLAAEPLCYATSYSTRITPHGTALRKDRRGLGSTEALGRDALVIKARRGHAGDYAESQLTPRRNNLPARFGQTTADRDGDLQDGN